MVLLMRHLHLIVLISKQRKINYLIINRKNCSLTSTGCIYKSILLVASDLNLCAIKGAFTGLLMLHFNPFFFFFFFFGGGGGGGIPQGCGLVRTLECVHVVCMKQRHQNLKSQIL